MPSVVWTSNELSMRPVDPTVGVNPCVRVLNLVRGSDGALRKRRQFSGTASGAIQNSITCELNGVSMMIGKFGTSIRYSTGGAFTAIPMAGTDPPINGGAAHPTERGSFALHGNEVYYCDSHTIFSWDGNTPARRPGVVSMRGMTYNGTAAPQLLPGGPLSLYTDTYYEPYHTLPYTTPPDPTNQAVMNPWIEARKGGKILNTAFAFSFYDPKRKTYGTRSEAFAFPYVFGPSDPDGTNSVLTDERTQYAKNIKIPSAHAAHPEYQIAVWYSLGQNILVLYRDTVFLAGSGGNVFYFNEPVPSMSKEMTDTLFLETIVNAGPISGYLACKKDNATLARSGAYLDVYERPVPAKFMAILPNGVAVYFFPWTKSPEDGGSASQVGNYAEFSVGHPEQVGRNTRSQRDTYSILSNLDGTPKAVVSDGNTQLVLTNHAVYSLGFDGQVSLHEIVHGRGLRAPTVAVSAIGAFWYSDDGVIWLRNGGMVLLDERLGFGDWFRDLSPTQREAVVIAPSDTTKQILIFVQGPSGQRCLCYDYQYDFVSEFDDYGGTAAYASMFRTDTESKLWVFGVGQYPDESPHSGVSMVEVWVNDAIDRPKQLQGLTIDLGPRSGNVTVEVAAKSHGDENETPVAADEVIIEQEIGESTGEPPPPPPPTDPEWTYDVHSPIGAFTLTFVTLTNPTVAAIQAAIVAGVRITVVGTITGVTTGITISVTDVEIDFGGASIAWAGANTNANPGSFFISVTSSSQRVKLSNLTFDGGAGKIGGFTLKTGSTDVEFVNVNTTGCYRNEVQRVYRWRFDNCDFLLARRSIADSFSGYGLACISTTGPIEHGEIKGCTISTAALSNEYPLRMGPFNRVRIIDTTIEQNTGNTKRSFWAYSYTDLQLTRVTFKGRRVKLGLSEQDGFGGTLNAGTRIDDCRFTDIDGEGTYAALKFHCSFSMRDVKMRKCRWTNCTNVYRMIHIDWRDDADTTRNINWYPAEMLVDGATFVSATHVDVEGWTAAEALARNIQEVVSDDGGIAGVSSGAGRFHLGKVIGMRGRMFRIRVYGPGSGEWSLQRITAEYSFEDGDLGTSV